MSEERQETTDKKKLVYEAPGLVKLNGAAGKGSCRNGSGATDTDSPCATGNLAGTNCTTGNTPDVSACNAGGSVV